MNKSKTSLETNIVEWNTINWKKCQKAVFKLQKRIYQASISGNIKQQRRLQKTLLRSWNAKLLATRQVTQDNQGKKTAGVDGIKSVPPKERAVLASNLTLKSKPLPARRIYIPKPGKEEKRPLSIPAMKDRALQALVKLVLEPEWEARFEGNSYGFRPGRSAHDAIEAIFSGIKTKAKYVLDADISKCFDHINHDYLIKKLNTFPTMKRTITRWLKAGWIFQGVKEESTEGTPQGGVISPLLANVALHGMEDRLMKYAESLKGRKRDNKKSLTFIRYADDFVILHHDINVILKAKEIISEWLKEVGLEISEKKTSIRHTLLPYEDKEPGFDFLGFNVRQYPIKGIHNSGKSSNGERLGFKTLIKPSSKKVKEHYDKICKTIDEHKSAKQFSLIHLLNPMIKGWANYYRSAVSKETFSDLDSLIWQRLWRWCTRRHPNKSSAWVKKKYFHSECKKDGLGIRIRNWVFKEEPNTLQKYADTEIVRHVKVKGEATPFNGDTTYWTTRMGRHPEVPLTTARLMKEQKGKCKYCNLNFMNGDLKEVDHVTPKTRGGNNGFKNLQLLHSHCHDIKTANDIKAAKEAQRKEQQRYEEMMECILVKLTNHVELNEEESEIYLESFQRQLRRKKKKAGRTQDKSRSIEEPCEVKVSRTVLRQA